MAVLVAFAIVAAFAVYVAYPLVSSRAGSEVAGRAGEDLLWRRNSLYRQLADLDFDFGSGKVSENDYHEQRRRYMDEAAMVLSQIDEARTGGPIGEGPRGAAGDQ